MAVQQVCVGMCVGKEKKNDRQKYLNLFLFYSLRVNELVSEQRGRGNPGFAGQTAVVLLLCAVGMQYTGCFSLCAARVQCTRNTRSVSHLFDESGRFQMLRLVLAIAS